MNTNQGPSQWAVASGKLYVRSLISLAAFGLVLLLANNALCQVSNVPYRLTDKEIEQILHKMESQADHFRSSLDSALDKSRFNNTSREDDINAFVKEFYEATKRLRDNFNHHQSAAADVDNVLQKAVRINGFMRRYPLTIKAQNDWSVLRGYLDELASAYNVTWRWDGYREAGPYAGSDLPYRVTDKEVDDLLTRIENQSDKFRGSLDHALDRSRLNNTRREDNVNEFVKNFYAASKRLRENFNDHKSTAADVESVLQQATQINTFMRRHPLDSTAHSDWTTLRLSLDELARIYNVTWRWIY
jgi:DNA repair exonuclease SbcCD ATPase subunit